MRTKRLKIVTKLDDSQFKPLVGSFQERIQIAYDNMWGMFKFEELKKTPEIIIRCLDENRSVAFDMKDFSWTEEVETAFFEHPIHKGFLKEIMERDSIFSWEMSAPIVTDEKGEPTWSKR